MLLCHSHRLLLLTLLAASSPWDYFSLRTEEAVGNAEHFEVIG
jgi:hypothetical protein